MPRLSIKVMNSITFHFKNLGFWLQLILEKLVSLFLQLQERENVQFSVHYFESSHGQFCGCSCYSCEGSGLSTLFIFLQSRSEDISTSRPFTRLLLLHNLLRVSSVENASSYLLLQRWTDEQSMVR